MVLRSFECTQTLLWIFCLKPRCLSARASGNSKRKRVLCFRPGNWSERGRLDGDVRRRKRLTVEQDQHWPHRAILLENPQSQQGSAPAGATDNHRGELTNSENHSCLPAPASSGSSTRAAVNVTNSSSGRASKGPSNNARKPKLLNLEIYTYHAMGDYVKTIQTFGTTDSYSTQPVSI